ncbi:MAG: hypothetical protein H6660_15395 [Ardenticatenaceae bacterium]|nr:hypothetical protein [Ardenticatenaceae bacterium]
MASRKKQLIPVLMLSLMLFFLVVTTQAQAAPIKETWRSTWQVAADFIGDQPNVTLIVSVEHLNSGGVWTAIQHRERAAGVCHGGRRLVYQRYGRIRWHRLHSMRHALIARNRL